MSVCFFWLVGLWSVAWPAIISKKGREVTLPCSSSPLDICPLSTSLTSSMELCHLFPVFSYSLSLSLSLVRRACSFYLSIYLAISILNSVSAELYFVLFSDEGVLSGRDPLVQYLTNHQLGLHGAINLDNSSATVSRIYTNESATVHHNISATYCPQ